MELVERLIERVKSRHGILITEDEAEAAIDLVFETIGAFDVLERHLRRKPIDELEADLLSTAEVYCFMTIEAAKPGGDTKVVNRVRGGGKLVQRRKKISSKKGFTWNSKKRRLLRIDALERLHRSRGAKIGSIKRKSEKAVSKIARARSMRMRKALGFDRKKPAKR